MYRFPHLFFLLGFFICIPAVGLGQLPVTRLTALSRSGGQLGTEFDLSITAGLDLEEVDQLQFSHPGITTEVLTDPPRPFTEVPLKRYRNFHVRLAADMTPGRYEVRAAGRFGLSNPRSFLVSPLANLVVDKANQSPEQAFELPRDTLLHAKAGASAVQFYRLDLKAMQALQIQCLAERIDSQCIPTIILLTKDGREVRRAIGTDQHDPTLRFTAEQDAAYWVAVHDLLYRGGEEYFYQLLAVDPQSLSPPVATTLQQISYTAHPSESSGSLGTLAVSAIGTIAALSAAETILEDATDQKLTSLPAMVRGSFSTPNDEDRYDFEAKAGERWTVEVISERLNQAVDPVLRLERIERDAAGTEKVTLVNESDDGQAVGGVSMNFKTRDPLATIAIPNDGTYRAMVRNLNSGLMLDTAHEYLLRIAKPEPDFQLVAYPPFPIRDQNLAQPWNLRLLRGDTQTIRVVILRNGDFSGPVRLRVDGLPSGVTASPSVIAANQQEAMITLRSTEDASEWAGAISITGDALAGETPLSRQAFPATITFSNPPGRKRIATRLCSSFSLSVSAKELAPLAVSLGSDAVAEMARGGSLSLPVRLTRRTGGEQKCVIRPQDLPPNVTAAELTIEKDKSEGTLELKLAPTAPIGEYAVHAQVESTVKFNPNPQALQQVEAYRAHLEAAGKAATPPDPKELEAAKKAADALVAEAKKNGQPRDFNLLIPSNVASVRIVDTPFSLTLPAAAACAAGSTTELSWELSRLFGFDAQVDATVSGGLENSMITAKTEPIAAKADKGKVFLTVPADTPPGDRTLKLKLSYTFNNQKLEVERSCVFSVVPPK